MKLHSMVMNTANGSREHSLDDLFLQLDEVESCISQIQENAEKLTDILDKLNEVLNEVFDETEDEF